MIILLLVCPATQSVLTVKHDRRSFRRNWFGLPQVDGRDPERSLEAMIGLNLRRGDLNDAGTYGDQPVMRAAIAVNAHFSSLEVGWESAETVENHLPNAKARKMLKRALQQAT